MVWISNNEEKVRQREGRVNLMISVIMSDDSSCLGFRVKLCCIFSSSHVGKEPRASAFTQTSEHQCRGVILQENVPASDS